MTMNPYASFSQRFFALLIDGLIFLPLGLGSEWLESGSKGFAFALGNPLIFAGVAYEIYCHGKYGRTIGKRVMGIRLSRVDGAAIGWRESWLRSSMQLLFVTLSFIGMNVALMTITDADYYVPGWLDRTKNLLAHYPSWLSWTSTASSIWFWSELIVMLCNRRRRSLHDFIAGTVVVADNRVSPPDTGTLESPSSNPA